MGDEYIAYVLCSRRRSYSDLSKSGKSAIKKSRILFVSNVAIVKIIFFLKVQIHYCTIFKFFDHCGSCHLPTPMI